MKTLFSALLAGLLMGAGFVVSGMTDPDKVIGFLDITGYWDPSLMLVMGDAVAFNLLATWNILKLQRPVIESKFHLPTQTSIDRRLVIGSILFGIGWGITGICPGPGVASLLVGGTDIIWFIGAMLSGFYLVGLSKKLSKSRPESDYKCLL